MLNNVTSKLDRQNYLLKRLSRASTLSKNFEQEINEAKVSALNM